jgi:hypothetical protein
LRLAIALVGRSFGERELKAQQVEMQMPPMAAVRVDIAFGQMMPRPLTVVFVPMRGDETHIVPVMRFAALCPCMHMPDRWSRNGSSQQQG